MTTEREALGSILLSYGLVEAEDLAWASEESERTGQPLLAVLRRAGRVSVFDAAFALLTHASAKLARGSEVAEAWAVLPVQR
jgi:hypothetical protein